MKLTKKILLGVLASAMTVSCFSGCGKKESANFEVATPEELDPAKIGYYSTLKLPIDDNFTKVSILVASDHTGLNDTAVIKELRRRTGLNVDIVSFPQASLAEKTKTMLASRNGMTDIFGATTSVDEQNEFGMQGAFVPIDEHLDLVPNLKEIFYDKADEYGVPNAIKDISAADGHLYLFPYYGINRNVNSGTMYRKDIFDKHGLKADWNGPEEFYQTLKKLKELYPDSTPFAVKLRTQLFVRLGESWGLGTVSDGNRFSAFYDEADGQWKYYATDARFKEILDFVKKLYDEGLLDPEFITITDTAWASKMTQADKVFVTNDWIGRMIMYKDQTAETVPGYDLRYGPAIGPTGKVLELPKAGPGCAVTNNKNSELALKLSDYLLSESGGQLITLGIEGVTYEIGEDGFADYLCLAEGESATINTLEPHGMFLPNMYKRFDKRCCYYEFTEQEQEAQEYPEISGKGYEPVDPSLIFTDEETEIRTDILPELSTAAEEFATQYILNNGGEKEWNEWLAKAKTLGEDKVLKVFNDAQARYNAKQVSLLTAESLNSAVIFM